MSSVGHAFTVGCGARRRRRQGFMMQSVRACVAAVVVVVLVGCSMPDVGSEGEPASEVVENAAATEPEDADQQSEAPATENSTPQREDGGEESSSEVDRIDLEIVESGFSSYPAYDDSRRASWAVVLENPNQAPHLATSIDVTVTLLDDAGSIVGSQSDSVAVILPGQRAAVVGSTYEDVGEIADIRVQARARSWEEQEGPYGAFDTSDVSVRQDRFRGWTVTGSVSSTFTDDFEDVYGTAVLRDSAGVIVGGGFTFIDFVPAGGDTSFEISVLDDLSGVATAEVYVSLSSLSLL